MRLLMILFEWHKKTRGMVNGEERRKKNEERKQSGGPCTVLITNFCMTCRGSDPRIFVPPILAPIISCLVTSPRLCCSSAAPTTRFSLMARAIASSSSSGPSLMSKDYRIPSTSHTSYHRHPPPVVMTTTNDPMISTSRTTSLAGKKRTRESDGDAKTRAFRRTKSVGDHSRSPKDKEKDRDRVGFQRSLIAAFVPAALRESLMGNMTNYNDLVIHFQGTSDTESPSLSPLQPLLRALTSHVNLLVPDVHAGLISAIIALPWATGDEKFLRTFVGFCGVLVSAQPAWAKEVVNMAVRGLSWRELSGVLRNIG